MFANGQGVEQDYFKTSELYSQSCDAGYGGGCFDLATMYAEGRGVEQDISKSKKMYSKACDTGLVGGCNLAK